MRVSYPMLLLSNGERVLRHHVRGMCSHKHSLRVYVTNGEDFPNASYVGLCWMRFYMKDTNLARRDRVSTMYSWLSLNSKTLLAAACCFENFVFCSHFPWMKTVLTKRSLSYRVRPPEQLHADIQISTDQENTIMKYHDWSCAQSSCI